MIHWQRWMMTSYFTKAPMAIMVKANEESLIILWMMVEAAFYGSNRDFLDPGKNTASPQWMKKLNSCKWLASPFISHEWPFGRGTTLLRGPLTMVINHLLTGMTLPAKIFGDLHPWNTSSLPSCRSKNCHQTNKDLIQKWEKIWKSKWGNLAAHAQGYRVTALHMGNGWVTL